MNSNYKELTDNAYNLHSKGLYKEAELIYKKLLDINPDDANILNLLGLLYIAINNNTDAINCLSKAYILNHSTYVAINLGKAYYFNSEPEKAIKIYQEASKKDDSDELYYAMAIAYKKLNKIDKVIDSYKKAIDINNDNYNAMYNLSLAYDSIGDRLSALKYAEKCLDFNKKDEDLYTLLSGFYEDEKKYNSAILMLEQAIEINDKNYIYYYNLGVLYSKINNKVKSAECYLFAINLNPKHAESYLNLASLYKGHDNSIALEYLLKAHSYKQEDDNICLSLAQTYKDLYENDKSIEILNTILNRNEKCSEAYSLLGINYLDIGEYQTALDFYNKALILSNNINYLHGKAVALKYLGHIDEAKKILEKIVAENRNAHQSIITLGMIYLSEKDFEKGMKLYMQRSFDSKFNEVFKDKIWNKNADINGKKVLVYTDCGLGDTIMYSRYLPILNERVSSLTLQTDNELINILKLSFKNINIIKKTVLPPAYDYVVPLMDIQYLLNMDFSNIPYSQGYLKTENEQANKVINSSKKKVGLFWQGNKKIFKNRSIPFEKISSLLENKNIDFYSFQKDIDIEETDNFHSIRQYINDYSDTARLLKEIDLLITIDSSIVHMAGALGVKTFLMLPYTAEWRWFNDTNITPWYNSVRIFRQERTADWDGVIFKIKQEL